MSTRTGARCTSCASSGSTAGLARCCGLIAYRCRCTCLGWSARADRRRVSPCSCHCARKPFCAQEHPPHDASTTGGSGDLDGRPAGATGVALRSLTNQAPELLLPASRDLANAHYVARDWNTDLKRKQETVEHDLQQCQWAEGKRHKLEAYSIEMEGSLAEAQADLAATQLLTLIRDNHRAQNLSSFADEVRSSVSFISASIDLIAIVQTAAEVDRRVLAAGGTSPRTQARWLWHWRADELVQRWREVRVIRVGLLPLRLSHAL